MRTAETDLREIKSMMERSSRFISLSGLSGVFAGVYALIGAWIADNYLMTESYISRTGEFHKQGMLILVALAVLLLSLVTAVFFTSRAARRKNQKMWDKTSRQMLVNLAIPLLAGGAFLMILLSQNTIYLIAPGMLIFYGLALINGSKYTLDEVRSLGYAEILLGLVATWFYGHGLLFWSIGFGWLHIIYGAVMYWKYER